MTYTPGIPNANDIVAQSQPTIKTNFEQLNIVYGTSGDHFAYNNTDPNERFFHAKITLPRLPTTNAPGNAVPAPGPNLLTAYSIATGGQSDLVYKRDNLATEYALAPIKAYAAFSRVTFVADPTAQTIDDSFNIASINEGPNGTMTVTLTNALPSANYGVIVYGSNLSTGALSGGAYNIINASSFTFKVSTIAGPGQRYTIAVLQF